MKKLLIVATTILILTSLSGCQWAAKKIGGDYTVNLKEGEKLVNVTWKDSNLWYLTKPMTKEDKAETYEFQEDSTFGVLEGTVTIVEHK